MGKFIITEEEKKQIRGLYEQQTTGATPNSGSTTSPSGSTLNDYLKSQSIPATPGNDFMKNLVYKLGGKTTKNGTYIIFSYPDKFRVATEDGKTFTAYNSDRTPLSNGEESMDIVYDNANNFYKTISSLQ